MSMLPNHQTFYPSLEAPKMQIRPYPKTYIVAALTLILSSGAYAAGKHGGGHGHGGGQSAGIGEPGKASEAKRTIEVVMTDNRYAPERISIKKGETIRFVIKNKGEFVHEFNIGTAAMHAKHQKEMAVMFEHGMVEVDKIHHDKMKMKMPNGQTMEHDDPNSVLLEPGKNTELVWKFSADARLEFACNLPGHYDAGMVGDIRMR